MIKQPSKQVNYTLILLFSKNCVDYSAMACVISYKLMLYESVGPVKWVDEENRKCLSNSKAYTQKV